MSTFGTPAFCDAANCRQQVSEGKRVCDLLPPSVVTCTPLPPASSLDANDWTCLHPAHIEDFLRVVPRPRIAPVFIPYAVVYANGIYPGISDKRTISVGLELYGYLSHVHVGENGNWTQLEEDIPRATWNLRIVGGPLSDIFERQADVLWDIEQHIIASIQGHGLTVSEEENGRAQMREGIFITRRVFHKVRKGKPVNNLAKGIAAQFHHTWRIPDTPRLGQRLADGTVRASAPGRFRRGDFVQVSVQFSVDRKLSPTPSEVIVRLLLKQIVLLVPAKDTGVGKIMPSLMIEGIKERAEADPDEAPVHYKIL
ncbi:hypothetical protein K488DRAFT_91212 [Vararia minispora EC-137]|uniref:Uncharacterized protein n=1 Tax=Vararia minispora EC-137 TaxID=1314806 RepID=A0ACB8Q6B5_9AGAM|nr:hypothetical protein K488DRAFT_91212 [Vararia minispora EC-137]